MTKKYLVTGGEGFIGTYICKDLVTSGHEVHSVDYRPNVAERIQNVHYHTFDIRETAELRKLLDGVDVVFHIAGLPRATDSFTDPKETLGVNVIGTRSVLEAAADAQVRRVIFASSSAIYGDQETLPLFEDMLPLPLSPYGFQKHLSEILLKSYTDKNQLEGVCLRFFNVFGYWSDLTSTGSVAITRFLSSRANNQPLTIYGDGTQTRDFVHVLDVAKACINAANNEMVGRGEVINIASGTPTTVNTIAEKVGGIIEYVSSPLGEIHDSCADITRAKTLLNWTPKILFADGVEDLKRSWGIV